MASKPMGITQHSLSAPPLEELASVLLPALKSNYKTSSADALDCPDLTQAPFHLASPGLSGGESVADIGGQSHLLPRPLLHKKYSLVSCAGMMNMAEAKGVLIGAGAAPHHVIGQNAELTPNLSWQGNLKNVKNLTHVTRVNTPSGHITCDKLDSTECALMMNLYGCTGERGRVLKVTARGRTGSERSFTECVRSALRQHYGDGQHISLGGVFVIRSGKAKFHVMPGFPPEDQLPFKDRGAVNTWLTYHDFSAPMVCLTVLHSSDPENLGLRMEHTHCFSVEKNEGGHYHYDMLPQESGGDEIEYEAYFNVAKTLYRIDKPQ